MGLLDGKFIVLGVSGGIAAYRACELARLLVKDGATVQTIMTEYAARLVGPITFQALTGRPAEIGHGGSLASAGMDHIDLGRQADAIVIAPATANTLARLAHGFADNLLTTTVLASTGPVIVAPAMNTRMWQNPVTQDNVRRLFAFPRFVRVGPDSGSLACGEEGPGRMAEPEGILAAVRRALGEGDLDGRQVLITAGPTREAIDPVRFLSNRSSGRMGYALAEVAAARGARVVLISGPTALPPPFGVERVDVVSAAQMARAVDAHVEAAEVVIMAAAVADYRPQKARKEKIKKGDGPLAVSWVRTKDILADLGRRKGGRILVGFAAETGDPLPAAAEKRTRKKLDLMVANDVSQADAGFEVDTNRVQLIDDRGVESLDLMSKRDVARRILDRVVGLLPARRGRKKK